MNDILKKILSLILVFILISFSFAALGLGNKNHKFIVCIDPGHQQKGNKNKEPIGPGSNIQKDRVSSGTVGVYTKKPEYVLNLQASLILKEILEEKGITVIMTRECNDVNISNRDRCFISNSNNADLLIRIHADGSSNPHVSGLSILTPSKNNKFTKEIYERCYLLSQYVFNSIKNNNSVKLNNILFRDDITGINWSKVPVILIELGYMSNEYEDKQLSNPKYLTNLMDSISIGIQKYLNEHK